MAHLVMTNGFVSCDSVDLSHHVRQATLDFGADVVSDTNMGDTTRVKLGGLMDWTLTLELAQDYATSSSAYVEIFLRENIGTTFTVKVNPIHVSSSPTGPGNPQFSGTGLLESYQPAKGQVGQLVTTTAVIKAAGTLSRTV